MKPLDFLKNFFNRSTSTIKMAEQISERFRLNMLEVQRAYREMQQMYDLITSTAHAAGGFIWRKNVEGRYLFANRTMCNHLLIPHMKDIKTTRECTKEILNKTDDEILSEYAYNNPYYSTFAEALVIADKHTMCSGERSEFLELGRIQGNPMLVQSVRTPVFSKDGALEGTIGFGLDVSDRCDELLAQVRSWVSIGGAEELHPSVYLLKKRAADCELTEQFIENNIE